MLEYKEIAKIVLNSKYSFNEIIERVDLSEIDIYNAVNDIENDFNETPKHVLDQLVYFYYMVKSNQNFNEEKGFN